MRRIRTIWTIVVALMVVHLSPLALVAQEARPIGQQTLGRPYWHVFAAYAVAWLLVFGWVISINRRLRRLEARLGNR